MKLQSSLATKAAEGIILRAVVRGAEGDQGVQGAERGAVHLAVVDPAAEAARGGQFIDEELEKGEQKNGQ